MLDPKTELRKCISAQDHRAHLEEGLATVSRLLAALDWSSTPILDCAIIVAKEIEKARKSAFQSALVTVSANQVKDPNP